MRLVVTGGRDLTNADLVERALSAVHRKHGIAVLIEGGQISVDRRDKDDRWGADWLCRQWAEANGIEVLTFAADWKNILAPNAVVKEDRMGLPYNANAGPMRNQQMIDEGRPNAAVAFPGGYGTADMVKRLERAGIPTWRVR